MVNKIILTTQIMRLKTFLAISGFLILSWVLFGFIVRKAEKGNIHFNDSQKYPFAVVELFTSEGCSSCPPAESLLGDLKSYATSNDKNIYVLEFHVDYW